MWTIIFYTDSSLSGECAMSQERFESNSARIRELNDKATQVLLFLSFAMLAAGTLRLIPTLTGAQKFAVIYAMRWWTLAIFPALVCVAPLKDVRNTVRWYTFILWLKFAFLWIALVCLAIGAAWFFRAL